NSTLRDYISGINSKHTLLVTDACFSGSIFKERAVFTNSKAILEMYKLPSRKAMTSGALKTVPDKSVFIQYLNRNLVNNQSPLLSAEQLFQSFKVAVINNSPNGQVPQYGPIGQAGDEGGDFIFLRRD
ncbi:MAG: peptidase C14, partial [Bacteroidota bacterium]